MARLLVVHHSPTPLVRSLTEAVLAGPGTTRSRVSRSSSGRRWRRPREDVLSADGFLLGTTANFGYMSGALKHFFDTIFLEAGGALADDGSASGGSGGRRPFGLWVHGRYDTTGAVRSVESIVGALPWQQAAPVLEVLGDVGDAEREAAYELGGTIAALLSE